ncbi:MAG: hypothetical protein ACK41W_15410 [Cyanobacteriota bacterium]|jgi:hypothetical protein
MIRRPPTSPLTLAALLAASLVGLFGRAQASTYRSANSNTVLVLAEGRGSPTNPRGFYFTTIAGREWKGLVAINQVSAGAGSVVLVGTFRDVAIGPGPALSCEGNIRIRRTNLGINPPSSPITANAVWDITGGRGCPSVGQIAMVSLVEPLPRPDRLGNFNAANSNTFRSETSGDGTWPAWRVVSADGQLNCRATPNGAIKKVYKAKQRVEPELRGVNAFVLSNGSPWLLTTNACYVRANALYLEPISIPL